MTGVRSPHRITAAVVFVVFATASTACAPSERHGRTPPPIAASPLISVDIPPISDDEVARSVADGQPIVLESVSLKAAESGVDYDVEVACAATGDAVRVQYRLSIGESHIGAGTIACDGTVYRNTGLTGSGRSAHVILEELSPGVTRAFARLVEAER